MESTQPGMAVAGAGLEERLRRRTANVVVLGLGYVGLPMALEFASAGFRVTGIDLSAVKVDALARGESYIEDVPSGIISELLERKAFRATTDFAALRDADAVVICVPTPLRKTQDPDVSHIVAAVEKVAEYRARDQLVVLESTTYPGTCEELLLPILAQDGKELDKDFFLAFSPERIDPGNPRFNTRNIPKVIGGVTPACTEMATLLYKRTVEEVVPVSSTTVAEMIKLLENTFRSVNIGLVNEIALMCGKMGIDVWEVIEGAASKPFGFTPFYPGPGLGGHCLPIDPLYLSWKAKIYGFEARFIELAARVNASMPGFVVDRVIQALNSHGKCVANSKILMLGVAYKRGVSDTRESPAIDIALRLREMNAHIAYHDPHVEKFTVADTPVFGVPLDEAHLVDADCVLIVTDHAEFDYPFIHQHAGLIVDTRNALRDIRQDRNKIVKL